MKERDRYLKIVEWSEEDKCYVGSAPGWVSTVDGPLWTIGSPLRRECAAAFAAHVLPSRPVEHL